jgi:adenosylmethionine-8-amino-7-oxononanoate aminotransferase
VRLIRNATIFDVYRTLMSPTPSQLAAWDHAYLWHPFTQMREWLAAEPLIIVAGDGNYLIDADGRRYLDGVSSLWCNVHGHRRPELDAALRAQLDRIAHSTLLGLASEPSIVLAKRLVELAPPNLTRVFYSDAGATAVEILAHRGVSRRHTGSGQRRLLRRLPSLLQAGGVSLPQA